MIVLRLSDGLGNQLFQYAASEALRLQSGAEVSYLTDGFTSTRARADRPLMLTKLVDCEKHLLPANGLRWHLSRMVYTALRPKGMQVRHIPGVCHITRLPGYHAGFHRISDGMLVSGYFQARQCVAHVIPLVRARVQALLGGRIEHARRELRQRYEASRLLALHVRLGDYQAIGNGREAVVPVERVQAAIRCAAPHHQVIVFTDTPGAVSEMELGPGAHLFDGGDPIEDFVAMAACDDFIIANSTYSWWASQIASAPDKVVWAPRDWSRPGQPGSDPANDIYLPEHRLY